MKIVKSSSDTPMFWEKKTESVPLTEITPSSVFQFPKHNLFPLKIYESAIQNSKPSQNSLLPLTTEGGGTRLETVMVEKLS